MTNKALRRVLAAASIFLSLTAVAACTSASGAPARPQTSASSASSPGYTGYQWRVVSVSHDGKTTAIPARYGVMLQFAPHGQFTASDGSSFYSGTYRAAGTAFTLGQIAGTANAYTGSDPILLLTINAMLAIGLGKPGPHPVALSGNQLSVELGSYTLTCDRSEIKGS